MGRPHKLMTAFIMGAIACAMAQIVFKVARQRRRAAQSAGAGGGIDEMLCKSQSALDTAAELLRSALDRIRKRPEGNSPS